MDKEKMRFSIHVSFLTPFQFNNKTYENVIANNNCSLLTAREIRGKIIKEGIRILATFDARGVLGSEMFVPPGNIKYIHICRAIPVEAEFHQKENK
jgi:hypothetical protein